MDSEDKFWVCVVGIVAITLISILGSFILVDVATDRRIADLIKSGTPPADAVCAMRPSYSGCTVRLNGDKK
jgi:hypothetical protein